MAWARLFLVKKIFFLYLFKVFTCFFQCKGSVGFIILRVPSGTWSEMLSLPLLLYVEFLTVGHCSGDNGQTMVTISRLNAPQCALKIGCLGRRFAFGVFTILLQSALRRSLVFALLFLINRLSHRRRQSQKQSGGQKIDKNRGRSKVGGSVGMANVIISIIILGSE